MKAFELVFDFTLQGLRQGLLIASKERVLDSADGDLRTGRDFLGEDADFILKAVEGENVVQESEAVSGFGVNHFAGIKHLGGDGRANELGKKIRSAIVGEQTDIGKILAKYEYPQRGQDSFRRPRQVHSPRR
jgi:hypothetical protein